MTNSGCRRHGQQVRRLSKAQSWKELLLDLKRRGLETGPELAVGDGALGFWKALREVYGETRVQRCWVHKTANVLTRCPNLLQAKAKGHLHDIWMAETRADAEAAFDDVSRPMTILRRRSLRRKIPQGRRAPGHRTVNACSFATSRPSTGSTSATNPIESGFRHGAPEDREDQGVLSRKPRRSPWPSN